MNNRQIMDAATLVLQTFPNGRPFLTGSVLTTPESANDIDFVVRASQEEAEAVCLAGWMASTKDYDNLVRYCIRNGKVNVIIVLNDTEYQRWHVATEALLALHEAEVTLDKAQRAALFIAIREAIK